MTGGTLHFEDVKEGDEAPATSHTLTRTDLVRYAGASGDYNPMHHDEIAATAAGQPRTSGTTRSGSAVRPGPVRN
jgi:acyl dehydratase